MWWGWLNNCEKAYNFVIPVAITHPVQGMIVLKEQTLGDNWLNDLGTQRILLYKTPLNILRTLVMINTWEQSSYKTPYEKNEMEIVMGLA